MMAQVLTIILNWRTAEMTLKAAEAALRAMEPIQGAITIVDNDSGDGSFELLTAAVAQRGWHRVRVIQSGRNGGFGAGNNVGVKAGLPDGTKPDFVYLLNSDAFPAPDAIRALRDHLLSHPATGFAGSYIHGPDGEAHRTAFRFPSIAGEFEGAIRLGLVSRLLKRHIVAAPLPTQTSRVDWLAGASIMMRQSVLDQVGLFDETFFLYFEETELCHRAARAGWPTDYVVESRVEHIGSVSTGMKTWARVPQFWLDSRAYYFRKVHGRAYATMATLAHVAGGVLWRARLLVQRKDRGDPPYFLRDLITHSLRGPQRPGPLQTRAAE
jgi:N-acetylglucosaminyl-diphospho-decaprenol L-rhamnosyltransferase